MTGLMTAIEVGVARRPGPLWQEPTCDLLDSARRPIGSVVRQPGGSLKPDEHIRYDVADPGGELVWHLDRTMAGNPVSKLTSVDAAGKTVTALASSSEGLG